MRLRPGPRRLAQKCPVEFINLVERAHSVGLPEGMRGECADDKREPLNPTHAYLTTAKARFYQRSIG
jgi:hypothetical protein